MLPFQTCLTQTKPVLPLPDKHGSQVKDQGRRQCRHTKHKKFPYQPTHDVSLLSGHGNTFTFQENSFFVPKVCQPCVTLFVPNIRYTCHSVMLKMLNICTDSSHLVLSVCSSHLNLCLPHHTRHLSMVSKGYVTFCKLSVGKLGNSAFTVVRIACG
jgi:hypothetical protein